MRVRQVKINLPDLIRNKRGHVWHVLFSFMKTTFFANILQERSFKRVVKEKYLINEAAKEVHVESHVLRYWEEELELPIRRNEQGHRIYTQEDIERFIRIKNLKDQGLQLKAVKTVLEQVHSDDENPFARKQPAKMSKAGELKVVPLKSTDGSRWNERFGNDRHEKAGAAIESENGGAKNMIEIKEMKAFGESSQSSQVAEITKEQSQRLQYLFQKLIKEAVASNNEEMAEKIVARVTENVKGDLCKELDYQFRLMEERDEERAAGRHEQEDKRNEEYYKRIDELLRQYSGKNVKSKEKNKEKGKGKDKTIRFPDSQEKDTELAEAAAKPKGETKVKREFHFFRRTAGVK